MRKILALYDIDNRRVLTSSGETIPDRLEFGLREQVILCLSIVYADLSPYVFGATDTFSAAIDNDFDSSTELMVKTENAGINVPGDWASADPEQGKLSIRLDCNTATFATKLATAESINAKFELQWHDAGAPALAGKFRFDVVCSGLIDDSATLPEPTTPANYYTKSETDALLVVKGDVFGPASSTDARPALFDGVTGKLLKQHSAALGTAAAAATTDFAAASHTHSANDITADTLDGDRLPALSSTKKGGVPATGTPSNKFLRDDGTWQDVATVGGGKKTYTFTLPTDGDSDPLHFQIQISAVADFASTIIDWDTRPAEDGVTGCAIFNGTTWEAYPSGGAGAPYYGERVSFTTSSASLLGGTLYYIRYRVHDGTSFSDWTGDCKTW